jgi:hypothetical protein
MGYGRVSVEKSSYAVATKGFIYGERRRVFGGDSADDGADVAIEGAGFD